MVRADAEDGGSPNLAAEARPTGVELHERTPPRLTQSVPECERHRARALCDPLFLWGSSVVSPRWRFAARDSSPSSEQITEEVESGGSQTALGFNCAPASRRSSRWPRSPFSPGPRRPSNPTSRASRRPRPTGLTADVSYDRVALTWDDPGDANITHYEVLRRDRDVHESGEFIGIAANTGSASTSYTDHTAQPLRRYRYRVKAVNQHGASQWSRFAGAEIPEVSVDESQRDAGPVTKTEGAADTTEGACPDRDSEPTPVPIDVDAVPIVVASTTAEYFVLYVTFDLDGAELDLPVLVKRGAAGTTKLAENVSALPPERYRVAKYLIANPADVDGDCIDDISELADPLGMNPVNPAPAIHSTDGAVTIPDLATIESLSDHHGDGLSRLKLILLGWDTDTPGVYFTNTGTHPSHRSFLDAVGLERRDVIDGAMIYDPQRVASNGRPGYYYFWLEAGSPSFSLESRVYALLAAAMPLLEGNFAFHIPDFMLPAYQRELPLYEASRLKLLFEDDLHTEVSFLALNQGEGYGLLRHMDLEDRPGPRDVVIYQALPNDLPRVAGAITTVRQTPLSHVNMRAVQNGSPNAYIRDALQDPDIATLLGGYVRYEVTDSEWTLRAATPEQVNEHYASSRPTQAQTPQRNLRVTSITPLSNVRFEDWTAFGVKAANVAELGRLGFPAGTVPDGFAIPFYFYDEFMKHNDFYARIETMLADPNFQSDFDLQDDMLDDLRDDIEDADSPQWIIDALTEMHASFPEGTSLRYRSSTNNEDLPRFNGAGLYDSKTQDPEETEEDGIDKSLKGVFARPLDLPRLHRTRVPSHRPPRSRDGRPGASQLLQRTGQRRGRQLRPVLPRPRPLLRQHPGRRGPGHQPPGPLGARGAPAVSRRHVRRAVHLQSGARRAAAPERRPTRAARRASHHDP